MKKLFVFGNGFDLCHDLPTSYSNFKRWLCNKYADTNCKCIEKLLCKDDVDVKKIYGVPFNCTNHRHLEEFSKKDFANYFIPLINEACISIDCEDWSDYENALGYVEWTKPLEDAEIICDEDGDPDPFNAGNNIEDMANDIYSSCHILNKLFREWIEDIEDKIDISIKQQKFEGLSNDDIYLNFNYTSTLETVYGIENVKHIHGYACGFDDLIVGHGNDDFDRTYFERNDLAMNAEQPIENTFDYFRKKTYDIINKNKVFFTGLTDINEIFIFGCSLNNIDKPYFLEIFNNISLDCKVYLNVHNEHKYKEKELYIKDVNKGKNIEIIKW